MSGRCNHHRIGSYNNYHHGPNSIPRGNQRWYGLVYLVYKRLVDLEYVLSITGVPYREVNCKVATSPKTQSRR